MAVRREDAFSGTFSQSVVVCLLALLIVMALIGMFSAVGVDDDVEWIGMTVKRLDRETAAALGIPTDTGGVMVGEVGGIARGAGIRQGDVVLGINGDPVRDMVDFSKLAGRTDLSRRGAQLDIIRRGVRIPVLVLPPGGSAPTPGQTAPGRIARTPVVIDRQWLGIDAETFTAGEGRELDIPVGVGGVLIDGVARGSQAEQAGLAVNDVIVSVNGQKTDTTGDLWNILAGLTGGDQVEFGVYRRGQLIAVALPIAMGTLAGGFRGRMGGRGLGPGGFLVCPSCGTKVAHQRGVPCFTVPCPSCGTLMIRAQ
jgi:S1-C subfamily serine protease